MLPHSDIKQKLIALFVEPEVLDRDPFTAFRILLTVGLISFIVVIALVFGFYHYWLTGVYISVVMNIVGSIVLIYFIYVIHKQKKVGWIAHGLGVVLLIFFPLFVYVNQAANYSMAWLFFVPFAVIPIFGAKLGLRYLAVFYIVIFSMAFQGIDVWNSGTWTILSFSRFVVSSLMGMGLALVINSATIWLNNKVREEKQKEQSYIRKLRKLSTTDSLTELYNRHHFKSVMQQKIAYLADSNTYMTFFILDIDHFKLYNDEFGHHKGDEVLYKVAQTIRNFVKRKDDLVFRLGGEEFGGILISDHPVETEEWLKPLRAEVEALCIPHSTKAPEDYVTISMGIYSSKIDSEQAIDKLYSIADQALYQAKRLGRNQVCIADGDGGVIS